MFEKSTSYRQTREVDIELTLAGQESFESAVFLMLGARVSDLLNDHRSFIPVHGPDGGVMMVAKSQIVSILERDTGFSPDDEPEEKEEENISKRTFNPYKILRIDPNAPFDEVRNAYKRRMKAVHPDSIAALDLDEDLAQAAVLATQKVNYAYKMIIKQRRSEAKKTSNASDNDEQS